MGVDILAKIAQANGRLKSAKVGAKIELRGERLVIRATLPPKPGSKATKPTQQRVSLGVHANPQGVSIAEAEARKISALADCGDFDWQPYLQAKTEASETVGEWMTRLESHYFERRERNAKSETTWRGDYLKILTKLPPEAELTAVLLRDLVVSTAPDSKTRKRACMVANKLAKLAGIEINLSDLAGTYSAKSLQPRDLPTDAQVAEWWGKISNPGWRWVYGMMATYGLRNHEVFKLDFDRLRRGDKVIEVLEGKTGSRMVWPFYPEWFDQFALSEVCLPPIQTDRPHEAIGRSVAHYLQGTAKIPFKPYDLRHCWAIRTIEFLLPVELAAQQMGHSVEVHCRTYHRWLTADHQQRFFDLMMSRTDRPQPPNTAKPQS